MSRATPTTVPHNPRQPAGRSSSHNTPYPPPSSPMSIRDRNGREAQYVPPPLPPPRHLGARDLQQDTGYKHQNPPGGALTGKQPHPDSSLWGGSTPGRSSVEEPNSAHEPITFGRRSSVLSMPGQPESLGATGRPKSGLAIPSIDSTPFQSEQQLGQKTHQTSSNAYDKQLLSKIGGPNTGANKHSKLEVVPDLGYGSTNTSSSRWTSEISSPGSNGYKSPNFDTASVDTASHLRHHGTITADERRRQTVDEGRNHIGNYESGIFVVDNDPSMDEKGIQSLNINERSPSSDHYGPLPGAGRRLASPPGEAARDDRSAGGEQPYLRPSQPHAGSRNSPALRFEQRHPEPGSIASTASSYSQHPNSYASSSAYAISVASSATSYGERLSPNSLDHKGMHSSINSELGPPASPFDASRNNPRGSLARGPPPHQRGPSDHDSITHSHNRKMSQDAMARASKVQGPYICECCPKKPKKFETEDELRTHELEKQYTCLYCPNRFKNKNEAERHQNSLHLRRHSWSCAALAGVHAAFHPSTAHSSNNDVCGYCGEEFPNPAASDVRSDHLNHVHKFGECNQAKKFFRADHFRQHLKHSHAGTSGKWTNQLENACMKEEPAPKEMVHPASSTGSKPGVIPESPHET